MSRQSTLARGRAAAEASMIDTCTIRDTTGTTTDDLTGAVTPAVTVVYTGPCRVQMSARGDGSGSRTEAGEATVVVLQAMLHLPVTTSGGVSRGDEVTIDTAVNDADLTGRVFLVRDVPAKSEATARRMAIEEVT